MDRKFKATRVNRGIKMGILLIIIILLILFGGGGSCCCNDSEASREAERERNAQDQFLSREELEDKYRW